MPFTLTAGLRPGKASEVRAQGNIPGVLYGPGREPVSVAVTYHDFDKLYQAAGESTLVDLTVNGDKPVKVLIQDVQYDPVSRRMSHVDFRQIRMDQEIETAVQLVFVGLAPAVKELGGTLSTPMAEIKVKSLPDKLMSSFEVDLSGLKTFEDAIHIKDLKLPAGVVSLDNPDALVAKVAPSLTEEQIKALEEAGAAPVDVTKIEVSEEKGKKEEEPAEGEAAPAKEEGAKKE